MTTLTYPLRPLTLTEIRAELAELERQAAVTDRESERLRRAAAATRVRGVELSGRAARVRRLLDRA